MINMAAEQQRERRTRTTTKTSTARRTSRTSPQAAAQSASRALSELTEHPVEGVSSVCRIEEGWRAEVEVLELCRIPDTTSLLATYEVDLDQEGELLQYRRTRRYRRGAADE